MGTTSQVTRVITPIRWKEIPGYSGYFVSSLGHIKNKTGFVTPIAYKGTGYLYVFLMTDNMGVIRRHKKDVHRLVWLCFGDGELSNKLLHVHHKDFNKHNNRIDNLELQPAKEHKDIHRRAKHGLQRIATHATNSNI